MVIAAEIAAPREAETARPASAARGRRGTPVAKAHCARCRKQALGPAPRLLAGGAASGGWTRRTAGWSWLAAERGAVPYQAKTKHGISATMARPGCTVHLSRRSLPIDLASHRRLSRPEQPSNRGDDVCRRLQPAYISSGCGPFPRLSPQACSCSPTLSPGH